MKILEDLKKMLISFFFEKSSNNSFSSSKIMQTLLINLFLPRLVQYLKKIGVSVNTLAFISNTEDFQDENIFNLDHLFDSLMFFLNLLPWKRQTEFVLNIASVIKLAFVMFEKRKDGNSLIDLISVKVNAIFN